LEEVAASVPDATIHEADTTNEAAVAALFSRLKGNGVQLAGIAHCAGLHWLRPIQLTSGEQFQAMLDSHLKSSLYLLKESITQRAFPKSGGSIVLFSSAAALQGGPGSFAYAVAKAGLVAATRVAAMEFAGKRIRINAILPGVVDTPQSRAFMEKLTSEQQEVIRKDHPLGIGLPEDVAAAADFLLSPGARWITGTALVVDGGLTAH
jgi:NAD(P)-dependent dehydrogenase (short-subunit alcohol dehydrogenase family)